MSYRATVVNIFIASPGDMQAQRKEVRESAYKWNELHGAKEQILLQPIGWETHSRPQMGAHPQSILNQQLLSDADIVIALFGTRLGTPTPEYASGTVEELSRQLRAGKEVMVYFSDSSIRPSKIDVEELSRLGAFKLEMQKLGVYREYSDENNLEDVFYRDLHRCVSALSLPAIESAPAMPPTTPTLLADDEPFNKKIRHSLGAEAKILLTNVSLDSHGIFRFHRSSNGMAQVYTNEKCLFESLDSREIAKWEEAVNKLLKYQLVSATGEGSNYRITNAGYECSDAISLE